MWSDLHELDTVHGAPNTHNKGGIHSVTSPLRVSAITNPCVACGRTFDRPTAESRQFTKALAGLAVTRLGLWRSRSQLQPLRAGDWRLSNVHRTRPRDASACSTAQKTGNTQDMDASASLGSTKRDGAGAGEQRRRRQLRRTASRTKQDGGANGSTMAVAAKPKADSKVEQMSLNKIMLKGTLKTH